jgi:hypothetical protein
MSKFSQPGRTVRDIKTLAGMADDLHTPHKMYMRLFSLETERHRRQQERASAMQRINNIDTRCAEIDQEKEQLLRLLGVESIALTLDGQSPAGGATAAPGDPARRRLLNKRALPPLETRNAESVKIRY